MSVIQIAKRRKALANVALLTITASLAACAPAGYPTGGAVYPVYSDRGPVEAPPYSPLNGFIPQRAPAVMPPIGMRPPEPTTPAPTLPSPAPPPGPTATPTPEPPPPPQATIDARPPGSRCGWWELCNLWE